MGVSRVSVGVQVRARHRWRCGAALALPRRLRRLARLLIWRLHGLFPSQASPPRPASPQSFQDELLALCGRAHDAADVYRAIEAVHAAGVPSWSLDLMSGLPQVGRV